VACHGVAYGVAALCPLITDRTEPFDSVWSPLLKQTPERLRSGKLHTIAALVRDVTRRDDEKRVSYGEASLVREGMSLIREELATALKISPDDAEAMVLSAVRERVRPEVPESALTEPELAKAS